jgi:ParB-like chromosome segregation protein Spo0J
MIDGIGAPPPGRHRNSRSSTETDPDKVASLAASMKEIRLQTPISIWVTDDNQWVHLVAGRHRLEGRSSWGGR